MCSMLTYSFVQIPVMPISNMHVLSGSSVYNHPPTILLYLVMLEIDFKESDINRLDLSMDFNVRRII